MRARARRLARTVVIAWATGALHVPSMAAAESPDLRNGTPAPNDAVLLFNEGRALLEAKDYTGAAAKFEESFRLKPGGGTQLNLALAYELAGRTASASAAFGDALRLGQRDRRADRIQEAQSHIDELEARLSRLRIVVSESLGASGLELRCDGIVLGETSWNLDVPLDPGDHRIVATAPDKKPWTVMVTLGEDADRQELVVPPLVDEPRPFDAVHLRVPSAPSVDAHASLDRGPGGYVALATAGVLAVGGVVAWRIREDNLGIYDDDSRCLVGVRTRDEQCGSHARAADLALGVEIGAFAAAGVSAAFGAWLLSGPSSRPRRTASASCAPLAAPAILCRGTF
jgi:hypothetical protein